MTPQVSLPLFNGLERSKCFLFTGVTAEEIFTLCTKPFAHPKAAKGVKADNCSTGVEVCAGKTELPSKRRCNPLIRSIPSKAVPDSTTKNDMEQVMSSLETVTGKHPSTGIGAQDYVNSFNVGGSKASFLKCVSYTILDKIETVDPEST